MIKWIRFAVRRAEVSADAFAGAWPSAVAALASGAQPWRLAAGVTLAEFSDPEPVYDGVAIAWFSDAEHLAAFEAGPEPGALADLSDPGAGTVIVAEELVLRGADWLQAHRRSGAGVLKHLALARRAPGLSPAEFSRRWREHAGRIGGPQPAQSVVIPEPARGLAYVQNHPRARTDDGQWRHDAVNEVYFERPENLRARVDWFRANRPAGDDLFGPSSFLAVREDVLAG